VFDALGLVAPVRVKTEKHRQSFNNAGVRWDDLLPESIYCAWIRILQELAHLNEIEIPRNISNKSKSSECIIHIQLFFDCCEIGLYFQQINKKNARMLFEKLKYLIHKAKKT
jgi:hypothetical protein